MRVKFQGDANLDGRIVRIAANRAQIDLKEIDLRTATDAGLAGLKDP